MDDYQNIIESIGSKQIRFKGLEEFFEVLDIESKGKITAEDFVRFFEVCKENKIKNRGSKININPRDFCSLPVKFSRIYT